MKFLQSPAWIIIQIIITLIAVIGYVVINSEGSVTIEGPQFLGLAFLSFLILIPVIWVSLYFYIKFLSHQRNSVNLFSLLSMAFLSQVYPFFGSMAIGSLPEILKNYIVPLLIIGILSYCIYRPMLKNSSIDPFNLMLAFIISTFCPIEFYLYFMNIIMIGVIFYVILNVEAFNGYKLAMALLLGLGLNIIYFPILYSLFATASQSEKFQQGIYSYRITIDLFWFFLIASLIGLSFIKKIRIYILLIVGIHFLVIDFYRFHELTLLIYAKFYLGQTHSINYLLPFYSDEIQGDLLKNELGFYSYVMINAYKLSLFLVLLILIIQYTWQYFYHKDHLKDWLQYQ